MKYVVDTCLINKLVDGHIRPEELPTYGEFVAAHIQIDEISRTKDENRRANLFLKFAHMIDELVPTESFVVGTSRLGEGKYGDDQFYRLIKRELDALNGDKPNNVQHALIAEIAMKNGFVLLTADYDLYHVAQLHGIGAEYWAT
jgi:hypothetical protein